MPPERMVGQMPVLLGGLNASIKYCLKNGGIPHVNNSRADPDHLLKVLKGPRGNVSVNKPLVGNPTLPETQKGIRQFLSTRGNGNSLSQKVRRKKVVPESKKKAIPPVLVRSRTWGHLERGLQPE